MLKDSYMFVKHHPKARKRVSKDSFQLELIGKIFGLSLTKFEPSFFNNDLNTLIHV